MIGTPFCTTQEAIRLLAQLEPTATRQLGRLTIRQVRYLGRRTLLGPQLQHAKQGLRPLHTVEAMVLLRIYLKLLLHGCESWQARAVLLCHGAAIRQALEPGQGRKFQINCPGVERPLEAVSLPRLKRETVAAMKRLRKQIPEVWSQGRYQAPAEIVATA